MSLYLDAKRMETVLLASGWHEVQRGTFAIDVLEFRDESIERDSSQPWRLGDIAYDPETARPVHGRAYGFGFVQTTGEVVMGFLASILAVQHNDNTNTGTNNTQGEQ